MAQSDKDDLISLIEENGADAEIPSSLPLLPVRDIVIFSDMVLPLFVGRDKSIRAVEEGVAKDGFLMLATQKDPAIEDPTTNTKNKNLPMAKQTIDILSMLQEKTVGNLSEEEENLLKNVLYDLRMMYVKAKQ